MLRNWGGIVDVTVDRSPIIGLTPVPGLYVNCGWGTGEFKALSRDQPHTQAARTFQRRDALAASSGKCRVPARNA
jgi:hypothetical protein